MNRYRVDVALRGPCEERLAISCPYASAENEMLAAVNVGREIEKMLLRPEQWNVISVRVEKTGEEPPTALAGPAAAATESPTYRPPADAENPLVT